MYLLVYDIYRALTQDESISVYLPCTFGKLKSFPNNQRKLIISKLFGFAEEGEGSFSVLVTFRCVTSKCFESNDEEEEI